MGSSKRRGLTQSVAVVCLLTAQTSVAQQVPDSGSLLRQQELQEQQLREPIQLPAIQPAEDETPMVGDDGMQILINDLRISGTPRAFSTDELKALVTDAIGQSLGLGGLQNLATRLTRHYRSHGYFLSRAYLPAQDATDGIITIVVQEVGLDPSDHGISIEGDRLRLENERVLRIIRAAVPDEGPVREAELERALLLLNQLPGVSAQVIMEPGSQPNTSRVRIAIKEGRLTNFSLGYDNAAGRYNGTHRLGAGIRLNDLTGEGDQLFISANASNNDNTYATIGYNRPVGHQGLQFNTAYSHLRYGLDKELKPLDATGDSNTFTLGLSYPLHLTRLQSLWLSGSLGYKQLEDHANGNVISDKHLTSLNLGLNWHSFHSGGFSQAGVGLRSGKLGIDSSTPAYIADQGINGPQKDGTYNLLAFNISRLQNVRNRFSLYASLDGQFSDANLDSAEQLQYSGPHGVRAYPTGEGMGDEGAKLTLEGRYDLLTNSMGKWQASLFYDKAWLKQYHNPARLNDPALNNHYQISGWGVGLTATQPERYQLRLIWACKIGSNPLADPITGKDGDGTANKSRIWATANFFF